MPSDTFTGVKAFDVKRLPAMFYRFSQVSCTGFFMAGVTSNRNDHHLASNRKQRKEMVYRMLAQVVFQSIPVMLSVLE